MAPRLICANDQANAASLPVRQDAEAVVLDLVNPAAGTDRRATGAAAQGLQASRNLIGVVPQESSHRGRLVE